MQTCDSVIENCCRMQRRCVVGGSSSTERQGKSYPLSSIPLYRWHSSRNEKKSGKQGTIEHFFDLGFAATVKT